MRMKTALLTVLCAAALAAYTGFGAATVTWTFLSQTGVLTDSGAAPLTAGDPAAAGDGTVLQLLAWVGGAPWGDMEPTLNLVDPVDATAEPNYQLLGEATVGDGMETFPPALADGRFSIVSNFDPAGIVGNQMVIRFFDEALGWYNELGDPTWEVPADNLAASLDPQTGAANLATNLGDPYGVAGAEGDNFATALIVPEPSTILLLGAGLGALLRRRRR